MLNMKLDCNVIVLHKRVQTYFKQIFLPWVHSMYISKKLSQLFPYLHHENFTNNFPFPSGTCANSFRGIYVGLCYSCWMVLVKNIWVQPKTAKMGNAHLGEKHHFFSWN